MVTRESKKKEKKARNPVLFAQGTVAKLRLERSTPARSGDTIKVSAKDGQSYAHFLREMKAKVNPRRAGLEVQSIRMSRKEEVLLVLKKGETFRRSSTRRSGRGRKSRPWFRRGPSKLGTLTRPSRTQRSCLTCAWHWADGYLTAPAGSSPALVW